MRAALFAMAALLGIATPLSGGAAQTGAPAPQPSAPAPAHRRATLPNEVQPARPIVLPKPRSGDELGVVPILEYHAIGPTEGRWRRTPQGLYQDLTWLYDHDFTLVTMAQYETGMMDVPAGSHPAVLTFDDGDSSQFAWSKDHVPSPDSAVGVLEAFAAAHPGFSVTATFFVNDRPFGSDSAEKMRWLVAHGFEIGNHTYTHADITRLGPAGIEREIGEEQRYIEEAVPGYVPVSFALPFGGLPRDAQDRDAVLHGSYDGVSWHFLGVALVGAGPAASPYSQSFAVSIPRIQVVDPSLVAKSTRNYILYGFEQQFTAHPGILYTGDGSLRWITFPQSESGRLSPALSDRANAIPAP